MEKSCGIGACSSARSFDVLICNYNRGDSMKTIKVGMVVVIATISMLARAHSLSEWISKSISARVPLSSSECVSPKSYTSAIANNVDDEAYIFEVARSNVVCQIPDDAVVGIESSHSNDVVHSVRFSVDGIEYVFLVQTRYGRTLPHSCFATGYSPLSTKGAVDERVKALFCRGVYRVYSITNSLDSSNVNVFATLPRVKVEIPWQQFYGWKCSIFCEWKCPMGGEEFSHSFRGAYC